MRTGLRVAVAVLVGAWPVAAQGRHPDFSGTWILDVSRSEASSFTPKGGSYAIRQHGDTLVIDRITLSTTGDTIRSHMTWGIDGKPWTSTLRLVGQDTEASSTLRWAGDTLVITTTSSPGGTELVQGDRWTLSGDHRVLTMQRSAKYGDQQIGSPTWILVKRN